MTRWPINHLTAEDLDAFHSASLSPEAREHLGECAECRTLTERDRRLLAALEHLPSFAPSRGFADHVMASIEMARPVPARRFARSPQRVAVAAALLLSLGTSIGWSLLNWTLLLSWLDRSAAGIGRALWMGVRIVASNLSGGGWLTALQEALSSSGRVALAGGLLLLAYGTALYALRRLLAVPASVGPHVEG